MARRKKTAEELKNEARLLLKKARKIERVQKEKKLKNIGQWYLKNEAEINSILPEKLKAELLNSIHG